MSSPIKILPHYTYTDYLHWEGKWELIDGVPFAMRPSPIHRHQIIAGNLHAEFRMQLKNCKKCQVSQPVDYIITEDTVLQPDMLITCGAMDKKYIDFPPVLVAEILSPATALKDRHYKYSIYESQGVCYYIIVDPDKTEAEVYELVNGKYQLQQQGRDFRHSFAIEDCMAEIDFKEIW